MAAGLHMILYIAFIFYGSSCFVSSTMLKHNYLKNTMNILKQLKFILIPDLSNIKRDQISYGANLSSSFALRKCFDKSGVKMDIEWLRNN
jgi:hypothetical protein